MSAIVAHRELCAFRVSYDRRLFVTRGAKLFFETRDFRDLFIPPSFEVAGNQAVLRIHRIILAVRAFSLNRGELRSLVNKRGRFGSRSGLDVGGVVLQQAADGSGPADHALREHRLTSGSSQA